MSTLKEYQSIKREAVPAANSSTIDKWVYLGGAQKMKVKSAIWTRIANKETFDFVLVFFFE